MENIAIMPNMNNKIKSYIVSSGGWEIEVDHSGSKGAVVSAVLMAFSKFQRKLTMSTVIMVNEKRFAEKDMFEKAEFILTHEIMNQLGFTDISNEFKKITL